MRVAISRLLFCLLYVSCAGHQIVATAAATIHVPKQSDSSAVAFDYFPLPDGVTGARVWPSTEEARDASGRLMKYDARAKRVVVLKDSLPYPNGVAVSADRTHVVVAHTGPCQLFRYWLKGAKAGTYELFADLPGYPDNIRRDARGGYWVALNREKIDGEAAVAGKHIVGVRLDSKGVQCDEMTADDKSVTL